MMMLLPKPYGTRMLAAGRRFLAKSVLFLVPLLALSEHAQATGILPLSQRVSPPVGASYICSKYAWACSSKASGREISMSVVNRVNRLVNARIYQVEDYRQYKVAENWTLPSSNGGDCEDIALLKKYELIRLGVPANRLLLSTVLDRQMRPHAVLIFRSPSGDYVLDSATNAVMPWRHTGYSFLRVQDPENPRTWRAALTGGAFAGTKISVNRVPTISVATRNAVSTKKSKRHTR